MATHHHVRVEHRVGLRDFELHVGDVRPAGGAAQALAQGREAVACDDDVVLACAGLGEDLAGDVFMFDRLIGFPGEIILAVEARGGIGQGHGELALGA